MRLWLFFFLFPLSLFQVVALPVLTLCAESTTKPVRLSTWSKLIQGRGPLQEVVRSGGSDAGQTHCDSLSIHRGEACMVQHRLRCSVRSGQQGCLAPEIVGALSMLALPMHVILVIGPSPLQ